MKKFTKFDFLELQWRSKLIFVLLFLTFIVLVVSAINVRNSYGHKTYTNSLVALGTILLAFATGISVQAIIKKDDRKQKSLLNKININHFNDIKQNLLDPMKTLVDNNYYSSSHFEIQDQYKFTSKLIQDELEILSIQNWEIDLFHSTTYKGIINDKLYKDIENHKITKSIAHEFKEVMDLIKNNSPLYLEKLSELYDKVAGLEEVRNFIMKVKQKHENYDESFLEQSKENYIRLIIILSLGYNIQDFSTYHSKNNVYSDSEQYEIANKISDILNVDKKVLDVLSLKHEVESKVKAFKKRIDVIESKVLLDDDCEELKQQRKIMYL